MTQKSAVSSNEASFGQNTPSHTQQQTNQLQQQQQQQQQLYLPVMSQNLDASAYPAASQSSNQYTVSQMLDSTSVGVGIPNVGVGVGIDAQAQATNAQQLLFQQALAAATPSTSMYTNSNIQIPPPTQAQAPVSVSASASIPTSTYAPVPTPTISHTPNTNNSMITQQIFANVGNPSQAAGTQNMTQDFIASQQQQQLSTSASTTLGGVSIPPLPPNSTTAMQVQVAAAAAAAAAAPPKGYHGPKPGSKGGGNGAAGNGFSLEEDGQEILGARRGTKRNGVSSDMTTEERKVLNRERNREHAKSTRARKKAYVNKLKELVDGLHAERSEEARKGRVAVQQLAEVQRVRRSVITTFLKFHAEYESDPRKWSPILEDEFYLKQPVTPYRSFRKSEIESASDRECRKSKGLTGVIRDAASMSVMVESVGNRCERWKNIKHEEVLKREEARTGTIRSRMQMPRSIMHQDSRHSNTMSSLSASSADSNSTGSFGEQEDKKKQRSHSHNQAKPRSLTDKAEKSSAQERKQNKVSSSSSGISGRSGEQANTHLYHDYHAQPLPDPKLDSASAGSDSSAGNDSDNAVVGKQICTDSSSGEDERPRKIQRKRNPIPPTLEITTDGGLANEVMRVSMDKKEEQIPQQATSVTATDPSACTNSETGLSSLRSTSLPPNIARSGGISHNIRPVISTNPRLNNAPAVSLPPFVGLGKRPRPSSTATPSHSSGSGVVALGRSPLVSGPVPVPVPLQRPTNAQPIVSTSSQDVVNVIAADNDTGSSEESSTPQITAFYHVNEDDMLLTNDVLMCPFIFRTQDAVLCGALAECVMPGMLRAKFSSSNKLLNLEMVYDAMGFMQQLGRASGNETLAEIIPNSIEMSLQPNGEEARVITTAKAPFSIVSVNGRWTKTTKFTQMEVEKKDLSMLEGGMTDATVRKRPGKPIHDFACVADGLPACSTNVYYDKYGKAFVAFVTAYPLTNTSDEITHLLHVYHELPEFS